MSRRCLRRSSPSGASVLGEAHPSHRLSNSASSERCSRGSCASSASTVTMPWGSDRSSRIERLPLTQAVRWRTTTMESPPEAMHSEPARMADAPTQTWRHDDAVRVQRACYRIGGTVREPRPARVDQHCHTLVACNVRQQQLQQRQHLTKTCKLWAPTWQSTAGC